MRFAECSFGIVIIAAGRSSRMGRPKMLLPWGETTVLGHEIELWKQLGAAQIAVVIALGDPGICSELDRLQFAAKDRIINPEPERGMFSSIQCAAAWNGWQRTLSHVAIVLGDQPHLSPKTLGLLLQAVRSDPDKIWQPAFEGSAHHPVVLPRKIFGQLAQSRHQTLREALDAMKDQIKLVELADPGLKVDIDRPADYERALRLAHLESRFNPE